MGRQDLRVCAESAILVTFFDDLDAIVNSRYYIVPPRCWVLGYPSAHKLSAIGVSRRQWPVGILFIQASLHPISLQSGNGRQSLEAIHICKVHILSYGVCFPLMSRHMTVSRAHSTFRLLTLPFQHSIVSH